ncbi:C40 family peptidase [Streptomyces wedmorensis]
MAVVVGAYIQAAASNPIGTAATLTMAAVPAEYRSLVEKAGQTCPQVSPNILAGLLYQESKFNPRAVSSAKAEGIAQFTRGTWREHGIDANRDGKRDVWDPEDAIPSAGKYLCTVAKEVKDVPGNPKDNMLAAYNAGSSKVKKYGGVPPYKETQTYVRNINAFASQDGGAIAQNGTVVQAAEQMLGKPYSWGGGNSNGPSTGICCSPNGKSGTSIVGFDCSGLTLYAYAKVGISLPRTAAQQYAASEPVKPGDVRAGDLVFYGATASTIHHVGIYVGGGWIINAPHPGAEVRYDPMDTMSDVYAVGRPHRQKEI